MKEFQSKKGGRKLYNDDFYNLQQLVNSNTSFFSSIGNNFVISGCKIDSNKNIEGYVFLDDKIRKVEKTSVKNMLSPAIIPDDTVIKDTYEDGNVSDIIYDYGCKIVDLSTTAVNTSKISCNGNSNLLDSFLGNFIAIANSQNIQNVQGDVEFKNFIKIVRGIASNGKMNCSSTMLPDGSIKLSVESSSAYWIIVSPDGDISFCSKGSDGNDTVLFNLAKNENTGALQTKTATFNRLEGDVLYVDNIASAPSFNRKLTNILEVSYKTEWMNIIDYGDNSKVSTLFCKVYNGIVYIQGTLPDDFCDNSKLSDYQYDKISNYGLPEGIPYPKNNLDFVVMSPQAYGVGITVHIANEGAYAGRFCFKSDAYLTNSESKFNMKYKFTPSVAWQYPCEFDYNMQSNYELTAKERFYACTLNNYNYTCGFLAYIQIATQLKNKKDDTVSESYTWVEAEYLGCVHRGNSYPNFCSTGKGQSKFDNIQIYNTGCVEGTMYFRSVLDREKLYSQTYYRGEIVLEGVKIDPEAESSPEVYIVDGAKRTRALSEQGYNASNQCKLYVRKGSKILSGISAKETKDKPEKYIDLIYKPFDSVNINTSGKATVEQLSDDGEYFVFKITRNTSYNYSNVYVNGVRNNSNKTLFFNLLYQ